MDASREKGDNAILEIIQPVLLLSSLFVSITADVPYLTSRAFYGTLIPMHVLSTSRSNIYSSVGAVFLSASVEQHKPLHTYHKTTTISLSEKKG